MAYPLEVTVVVTTHYLKEDEDCLSDYCSVDISIDGIKIAEYGDAYHDRGREKSQGFIAAIQTFHPSWGVQYNSVADFEE
jgi:hypothetical protein